MSHIVLDISRLISRVRHFTPSGVDRVEMAYARGLLARYGDDLAFAAVHPGGAYGRLRRHAAIAYLDHLDNRWAADSGQRGQLSLTAVSPWMARLVPRAEGVGTGKVLVQVSPHHLHLESKVRRKLAREQARFVCMVHDLIPIEFPEYARPGGALLHARRMETVSKLADAIIVNSEATAVSLNSWIEGRSRTVPAIHVAHLGTHEGTMAGPLPASDGRPYFVCIGTIEPRKNHLLLLQLWRQMAKDLPADQMPRLLIIGRRGWENEQIVDLLERCEAIAPFVEEIASCSDADLATYIKGANALLMPSFAEGFGMPIAEALALGTPVIASDIAAHHEVGAGAPDFRDPLDGPSWREAILDYASDGPMRLSQLTRMTKWQAPQWGTHLDIVTEAIGELFR